MGQRCFKTNTRRSGLRRSGQIRAWIRQRANRIIPRVEYKLSRHFSVDLNVPVNVYNLRYGKMQIQNPSIPVAHQTSDAFYHLFFDHVYTIRLGVMYSFAKQD